MPLSVGKVEKIAEQGMAKPFHSQYLRVVWNNNFMFFNEILTIS
jgi:hypothetical protein